jgi:hypothetical protein
MINPCLTKVREGINDDKHTPACRDLHSAGRHVDGGRLKLMFGSVQAQ